MTAEFRDSIAETLRLVDPVSPEAVADALIAAGVVADPAEVERLTAALHDIAALHQPETDQLPGGGEATWCISCGTQWPCATATLARHGIDAEEPQPTDADRR